MRYRQLAERFEALEAATERLELTTILVTLLRETTPAEAELVAHHILGQLGPPFEAPEVGLAENLVLEVLAFATGRPEEALEGEFLQAGDLGTAAEEALARSGEDASARQTTIFDVADDEREPLTLSDVHEGLLAIATASGEGSQATKKRRLHGLLDEADPLSARYIVRTVTGTLRLGVADRTLVDALAYHATFEPGRGAPGVDGMTEGEREALEATKAAIARAYNVCSDVGKVARRVVGGDMAPLEDLEVQVGVPVRPMLAERLSEAADILEKTGGKAALEYKYDGLRLQAHVRGEGAIRFFSRRLEDLGGQFPDVAGFLEESFEGDEAIVEGEVVAVDLETGAMRPFQRLAHRRGRKHDVERMTEEVPVALYLFDVLYLDGEDLTGEPLPARREALEEAFPETERIHHSHRTLATEPEGIEAFMQEAVRDGAEGIMAKDVGPGSRYRAGARGWRWIKYKADYDEALSDSLDLVVVGASMGRGRRRGWYGSLLLATYDPDRDVFETVCKVATGFEDEDLRALKPTFEDDVREEAHPRVESETEPDVWLDPRKVAEIIAADITVSPVHTTARGRVREEAGMALRFPRFEGWREDKAPEDATTGDEVVRMYRDQEAVDGGGGTG